MCTDIERKSDVDAPYRELSILDEIGAQDVVSFDSKNSLVAGSVWGDMHRNKFLKSVRNPPRCLTPAENEIEEEKYDYQ